MTDFGISKEGLAADNDRTATFCGTPEYLGTSIFAFPEMCSPGSFGRQRLYQSSGLVEFRYSNVRNANWIGKITLANTYLTATILFARCSTNVL